MTLNLDEKLRRAHEDGRRAERERIRLRILALHEVHAAELLERERRRVTRGGTWDLDPVLHHERGALKVLDILLADVAPPKDSGAAITREWLAEQLEGV